MFEETDESIEKRLLPQNNEKPSHQFGHHPLSLIRSRGALFMNLNNEVERIRAIALKRHCRLFPSLRDI